MIAATISPLVEDLTRSRVGDQTVSSLQSWTPSILVRLDIHQIGDYHVDQGSLGLGPSKSGFSSNG